MSIHSEDESAAIGDDDPAGDNLPDELPPVEPPSAGFIVQLFFVPAVIVMAIVGVWALFGMVASGDQDIQRVLADTRSTNPHRRGPALHKLAQMLRADTALPPDQQQYVGNQQVAAAVAEALQHWINKVPASLKSKQEVLTTQNILTRALGWFDVPGAVGPSLLKALQIQLEPLSEDQQRQAVRELQQEVRKGAVTAMAKIANRALERERPLDDGNLVEELIAVSGSPDEEPVMRQLAAFALGLFRTERATRQLNALLLNSDANTRLNAAIALARQNSTEGFDEFKAVFSEASKPIAAEKEPNTTAEQRRRTAAAKTWERSIKIKNAIKAISGLADKLTPEQRAELTELITPITKSDPNSQTRFEARQVVQKLSEQP